MQLNKYLAHAGISSRRKAVEIIKQGIVSINNWVVKEPGYIVKPNDAVRVNKKLVALQQHIYVLLNKPQGFITTVHDEKNRPTVLDLLSSKIKNKMYPVGRLDCESTGLIVLTNDGALAQRLAHPRYETSKIYIVTLDQPYNGNNTPALLQGINLEDGRASVDALEVLNQARTRLKVTLHSGKNRIIRRLFEYLGYQVVQLDRVGYACLSKKRLSVGHWRFLTSSEIKQLQNYGTQKKSKNLEP
jgi:23S rRNA pseudouridine2605 synthase